MRIAILEAVHPLLAERLRAAGHQVVSPHIPPGADPLPHLRGAQGLVVRSRELAGALLAAIPGLRFVGRIGAGLENIDTAWCERHGVRVFNSPEGNRDGVGEACVLLLLALLRNLLQADAQVRRGLWEREANRGTELHGRTVGIIGFGNTGSAFAERLAGFGVRVLAHDKYRTGFGGGHVVECPLDRVLAESDVLSLHLPLTAETRRYANAAFFDRPARPVWFINTSRGAVVHTAALLDALDAGRVLGAGLDVLEFERPDLRALDPAVLPDVQRRLFAHPRTVLMPHVAGVTHEGHRKMAAVLATRILEAFPHGTP